MKKTIFLLAFLLTGCTISTVIGIDSSSNSSSGESSIISEINSSYISSEISGEDSISSDNQSQNLETSSSDGYVWPTEFYPASKAIETITIEDEFAYSDNDTLIIEEQGTIVPKTSKINFFEINDTHGALNTLDDISGMDKIASMMKENSEENGDYINLLVGDIFQGGWLSNNTKGRAYIDILNELNFSCFVLGNHEFDWGLDVFSQYKDGDLSNGELDMPVLGANIYYANTNTHPGWIDPYTIVNSNGYRVGIIGAIGEEQYGSISSDKASAFEFKNTNTLIKKYAKELRTNKNCDVVVLAIHEYSEDQNLIYGSFDSDSYLDAIFCAHTHQKIEETVTRQDGYLIPVIQSNTKNINGGIINMTINENKKIDYVMRHKYAENYPQDESIIELLEPYKEIISEGETAIGYTSKYLNRTAIGEDTTQHLNEYYQTDFACINTGGVRANIDSGYIKKSKLLEVYPFDNKILLVKITGRELNSFISKYGSYLYSSKTIASFDNGTEYKMAIIDFVYMRYINQFENTVFAYSGDCIRDDYVRAISEKYPLK